MRKFLTKCLLYVLAVPVTLVLAAVVYALLTGFTPYDKYNYFYTAVKTVRMLEQGDLEATGSGVVIAPGRLITAAHLFNYGTADWRVNDGDMKRDFVIVYIDPEADVAVLAVRDLKCPCAPLARNAPGQFTEVFAIGYPLGIRTPTLTTGRWQAQYDDYLDLMTTPVTFGNSGGPVFIVEDGMTKMLGLVSGMKAQPVQLGFRQVGIPVNHLSTLVRMSIIKQTILCADGFDFDYCALGNPGDAIQ